MNNNTLTERSNQGHTSDNTDHEWLTVLSDALANGLVQEEAAQQVSVPAALGQIMGEALADSVRALLTDCSAAALTPIEGFYEPGDVIELRALDPAGSGALVLCGRLDVPAERKALEVFVQHHNGRRNLYLGINPRHPVMAGGDRAAKAGGIVARRAMVLDFDNKDARADDPNWSKTVAALRDKGVAHFVSYARKLVMA